MDNFNSDNFFDLNPDSNSLKWSERDWSQYVKSAEKEVEKFASFYALNRFLGKSLEEIAAMMGYNFSGLELNEVDASDSEDSDEESVDVPEIIIQPWTVINHPVYVICRGLNKCLDENFEKLITLCKPEASLIWSISKSVFKYMSMITLAIDSSDLCQDTLARYSYKSASFVLNETLAKIAKLEVGDDANAKETLSKIHTIIFDLREVCLNLSSFF